MIRLQINPAYAQLLQSNHLSGYARLMACQAGDVIEEDDLRDVRRLRLDGQTLYLKRTKSEKAASAFETYGRGRLAHSKPFTEMLHFRYLAERGFDVAEVVATGEELSFGIPQRGFIVTAEVAGQDLAEAYQAAGKKQRLRLLGQFGGLLGRLHDHGFYGSTRLKDIIYHEGPGEQARLTLIDREVRNPRAKRVTRDRILSRLLFNIRRQTQQGEVFSDLEWREFCDNYCASLSDGIQIKAETLHAEIKDQLRRRQKRHPG